VPDPCHEDWNQMSVSEKGRFCSSCEKVVHDFTNSTQAAIVETYHQLEGQLCGRFKNTQITKPKVMTAQKWSRRFMCALLIAFGVSLFQMNGMAQSYVEGLQKELLLETSLGEVEGHRLIEGIVKDQATGKVIPFASVIVSNEVSGQQIQTNTDKKGQYKVLLTYSDFPQEHPLNLEVANIGYTTEIIQNIFPVEVPIEQENFTEGTPAIEMTPDIEPIEPIWMGQAEIDPADIFTGGEPMIEPEHRITTGKPKIPANCEKPK